MNLAQVAAKIFSRSARKFGIHTSISQENRALIMPTNIACKHKVFTETRDPNSEGVFRKCMNTDCNLEWYVAPKKKKNGK